MDDIARKMGMSKKTLYQHFDSKNALVEGTIQQFISEEKALLESFQKEATNALDEMIKMARYVVGVFTRIKPVLLHDLQKYYGDSWNRVHQMQSDTVYKAIRSNILRGQEENIYRAEVDADIITQLYVHKSMLLTSHDAFTSEDINREELVRQHIMYHLHGILSHEGRTMLQSFKIFE